MSYGYDVADGYRLTDLVIVLATLAVEKDGPGAVESERW
jgi:hypothetical protein